MRLTTITMTVVLSLLIGSGCVGFYTRLFETRPGDFKCVDGFCFIPRVVSYQEHAGIPENMDDNNFWISIKIRDTATTGRGYSKDHSSAPEREEAAASFKNRMLKLFRFDSLVLRVGPEETPFLLLPDTTRYTPRDLDFLSFHFGDAIIPLATDSLRAVFYYRYFNGDNSPTPTDSVVYGMDRVETGEAFLGLKQLIPERGEPQSEE
ncbi:MAG: hypothetical protein GY867_05835 [bacterium]|nr:hypothetical protein [bacterium]